MFYYLYFIKYIYVYIYNINNVISSVLNQLLGISYIILV